MKCFVLMPFGDRQKAPAQFRRMEELYSEWIKPTVESLEMPSGEKIACHRADKESGPGSIIEHVVESILGADIVIADLSGKNANVFYELGVRHAVRNGTILVAEGAEHVPFDLRPLRTIIYEYTPSGMLAFRKELEKAVSAVLSNPQRIDNPVRKFVSDHAQVQAYASKSTADQLLIQNLQGDIIGLRQDVLNQFAMIRDLMRVATDTGRHENDATLARRFEGVWKAPKDGSIYCVKMIGDRLYVPYSNGEEGRVRGHLLNCVIENEMITCRFEWINQPINGFVMLRAIGGDTLSGGWCLAEDLPLEARNFSAIAKLPFDEMNELTVHRDAKARYPIWAAEYFERIRRNNPSQVNTV